VLLEAPVYELLDAINGLPGKVNWPLHKIAIATDLRGWGSPAQFIAAIQMRPARRRRDLLLPATKTPTLALLLN
jgi:hypothetical protein